MNVDLGAWRARLTPDRPALWVEDRWLDYRELDRRAGRLAGLLAAQGLDRGARVGILAHNHPAHIDLMLAAPKAGIVYMPFNHRLAEREQAELAAYARPDILFHDEANTAKARAAEAAGPVSLRSLEDYEEWLTTSPGVPDRELPTAEDIQMILFTGGTTGTPKGAMLPYRQGFYNAVNTVLAWGLHEDDCVIQATPCFHAAVNAFTVPLLHVGARVVLESTFDPGEYLSMVARHRATILFMVPTMYQMLFRHPDFASADLSSVRWAISGGAPCPEPIRKAFAERGIPFKQGYGLTEAGVNCFAMNLPDALQRPSSVGHPMPHSDAAIRDEGGVPVARGEVGELTLRGPHLFAGYFERPEETSSALKDGWLWTGDLARQDAEGFYYLAGRRKEMFISGGENIFPVEIENVLYGHSAVAECCVVGIPDETWGEVGLAAIVLTPEVSVVDGGNGPVEPELAAEIRSFLQERLGRFKVPKRLLFLPELPKSGAGKVLRREIVRLFEEAP